MDYASKELIHFQTSRELIKTFQVRMTRRRSVVSQISLSKHSSLWLTDTAEQSIEICFNNGGTLSKPKKTDSRTVVTRG